MGLLFFPQCSTGWAWGFARKANDDSVSAASGYVHKPTGKMCPVPQGAAQQQTAHIDQVENWKSKEEHRSGVKARENTM